MRWYLPLFLLGCAIAARAADDPKVAAAAAAQAAWSPDLRAALGFEEAKFWDGGETVTDPRKSGDAAVQWAQHKSNSSLTLQLAPLDLSAFNTISFWVHSSAANGETFMLIADSQHDPKVFSYYSTRFTVDWTGWKQLSVRLRQFGKAREPVGWNKITRFRFAASGWNQAPRDDSVWVFDDLQFSYDPTAYRPQINVHKYIEEPAREAFLQHLQPGHPRLILLDDQLPALKQRIAEDSVCTAWYEGVQRNADALAKRPPQHHHLPDGRRLLGISRDVLNRIYHWGLLYRLEGDRKWLDRAWQELQAVVNFPDWNPSHYLDTAEMMHAVAIGYDWFYDGWTDEQRKVIREGLWQHGLRLSYAAYMGLEAEGMQSWRRVTNNWNFVCNGGSSLAAMAVLDELPQECTEVLHAGIQYIQIPLESFEPDGAWWEGIGYWGYSMRYLLSYLRGLETAFGTDFGMVAALRGTGFSKSGDFPIYLTSPKNGYFNFADSGSGGSGYQHWGFFYLAARFHNPLYLHFQYENGSASPEDLIYYEPFDAELKVQDAELDRHFRGAEVATSRSSWTDPNALFLGIKSGRNGIAHSHEDLGSFAFYELGEKWVMDLGTEGQTYQSHKHHLPHWHFYRIRTEGHNTLVFNPQEKDCQDGRAASTITRYETSPDELLATVDLTAAYEADATKVTRGFRLFNQRRALLVQDEITSDQDNELWWFAHGDVGTKMTPLGNGREVLMERNGKVCTATLLSPDGARLSVMPARPLPTSPDPDIQQQNKGISKLAVHLPQAGNVTISVLFSARYGFEPGSLFRPKVEPIADWKLSDATPELAGLNVDGKPLSDFSPRVFTYTVEVPDEVTAPPVVTVQAVANQLVSIQPAEAVPGTTRVTVTVGGSKSVYLVRCLHPLAPGSTEKPHFRAKPVTVGGITVMASRHDGNEPQNVLDDDPETRWSASGDEEWISFDFGQARRLETVQIAWYSGEQRKTGFQLETSADGKAWQKLLKTESGGKTKELESYSLPQPLTTRYFRIVGYGNTQNLWNSITAVKFQP